MKNKHQTIQEAFISDVNRASFLNEEQKLALIRLIEQCSDQQAYALISYILSAEQYGYLRGINKNVDNSYTSK